LARHADASARPKIGAGITVVPSLLEASEELVCEEIRVELLRDDEWLFIAVVGLL
jgi:hypothetical protein